VLLVPGFAINAGEAAIPANRTSATITTGFILIAVLLPVPRCLPM
jgi:hypothetical protein